MKKVKSLLLAVIPFLVLALAGCESVEENSGSFWSEQETTTTPVEQTPTPTPPADDTPDTGGGVEVGVNTFLWKPVSEAYAGHAVALTPANIEASSVTCNGESGTKHPRANGNRQHFRFSKTGADYGLNVKVVATLAGGGTRTWTVPNGGSRWSSN